MFAWCVATGFRGWKITKCKKIGGHLMRNYSIKQCMGGLGLGEFERASLGIFGGTGRIKRIECLQQGEEPQG